MGNRQLFFLPDYGDYDLPGFIVEKQYRHRGRDFRKCMLGWEAARDVGITSPSPGHLPPGIHWSHPWPHVSFVYFYLHVRLAWVQFAAGEAGHGAASQLEGGAVREPALGAGRWLDLGLHPPRPWGQRRTEQMWPLSGKRSCARLSQLVGKDKGGRLHPTVRGRGCRI